MLPRISYFPFYLSKSKLNVMINNLDDDLVEDLWLQFNGKALKWFF